MKKWFGNDSTDGLPYTLLYYLNQPVIWNKKVLTAEWVANIYLTKNK